eukprot:gene6986-4950_t
MLDVTFAAVSKVIIAVLIGAYASGSIPYLQTTMRDYGFLISSITLPALTVYNTARSVDLDVMIQCSILVIMNILLMAFGVAFAYVFQFLFFNVHRGQGDGRGGVPRAMAKDVQLYLRYDTGKRRWHPRRSTIPTQQDEEPQEETAKEESAEGARQSSCSPHTPTHVAGVEVAEAEQSSTSSSEGVSRFQSAGYKGIPYVAVRLSKAWQQAGVTARDVVPHLTAPTPESDYTAGYAWTSYVAFSIFNVVTLPLSLMESLAESLSWLSFANASAYIFVFGIGSSIYTWSGGPFFVKKAKHETKKRRYIRLLLEEHLTRRHLSDAATQTGPEAADGEDTDLSAATAAAAAAGHCERFPYDWESAGLVRMYHEHESDSDDGSTESDSQSEADDDDNDEDEAGAGNNPGGRDREAEVAARRQRRRLERRAQRRKNKSWGERAAAMGATLWRVWGPVKEQLLLLLKNPPFTSIFIGMIIGLVPFLHDAFFDGGPLEMLMDVTALLAQCSIPSSLLLLGSNLAGTSSLKAPTGNAAVASTERADDKKREGVKGKGPALLDGVEEDHPLLAVAGRVLRSGERVMRNASCCTSEDAPGKGATAASSSSSTHARRRAAAQPLFCCPALAALAGLPNAASAAEALTLASEAQLCVVTWEYDTEGKLKKHSASFAHDVYLSPLMNSRGKKKRRRGAAQALAGEGEEEEGEPAAVPSTLEALQRTFALTGISHFYVFGIIIGRLLVMPLLSFALLVFFIKWFPFLFIRQGNMNYTMVLTLFIELATPTAINSAIIFAQEDFMTYHWAKMLFLQYILCIGSMVLWTWLGLLYTQSLGACPQRKEGVDNNNNDETYNNEMELVFVSPAQFHQPVLVPGGCRSMCHSDVWCGALQPTASLSFGISGILPLPLLLFYYLFLFLNNLFDTRTTAPTHTREKQEC